MYQRLLTQEIGQVIPVEEKRFQKDKPAIPPISKHGRHPVWVAFWWKDGIRFCRTLGRPVPTNVTGIGRSISFRFGNSASITTARGTQQCRLTTFEKPVPCPTWYLPLAARGLEGIDPLRHLSRARFVKSHLVPGNLGRTLLQGVRLRKAVCRIFPRPEGARSISIERSGRICGEFLNGIFSDSPCPMASSLQHSGPSELRIPRHLSAGRCVALP